MLHHLGTNIEILMYNTDKKKEIRKKLTNTLSTKRNNYEDKEAPYLNQEYH